MWFRLLLAGWLAAVQAGPEVDRVDVRDLLVLEHGARVRAEHYAADGGAGPATAELLRLRSSRTRWQLHRTVRIGDGETEAQQAQPYLAQWHQVEVFEPDGVRIVFRELAERAGRSVRSEWRPAGRGRSHCHGEAVEVVRELATDARCIGRLGLLELCRTGRPVDGTWRVLEPTSGRFERLEAHTVRGTGPLPLRLLALSGERGEPRGAAWFLGGELLAFRDGGAGPWFVRVAPPDGPLTAVR